MKKLLFFLVIITTLFLTSCKNYQSDFNAISNSDLTGSELYMLLSQDTTTIDKSIKYEALYIDNTIYLIKRDSYGDVSQVLKRDDYSGGLTTILGVLVCTIIIIIILIWIFQD